MRSNYDIDSLPWIKDSIIYKFTPTKIKSYINEVKKIIRESKKILQSNSSIFFKTSLKEEDLKKFLSLFDELLKIMDECGLSTRNDATLSGIAGKKLSAKNMIDIMSAGDVDTCKKIQLFYITLLKKNLNFYNPKIEALDKSNSSDSEVEMGVKHKNHQSGKRYQTSDELSIMLFNAVQGQDTDAVNDLLKKEAKPEVYFSSKNLRGNCLHLAALGNNDILKSILEKNTLGLVNSQENVSQNTPLHIACYQHNSKGVELLLNYDANLTLTNIADNTPLIAATQVNDLNIAKLLLKKQANPTVRNKKGNTALHYAVTHNNLEMVTILVDAISKIGKEYLSAINSDYQTPLDIADSAKNMEIATFLRSKDACLAPKMDHFSPVIYFRP